MIFDWQMQTKNGKHLCLRRKFYGYLSYAVVDIILCTPRISSEGKNSYWCIPLHVFWSMKNYSKARPWWISSSLKFSTNSLIAEKHITLRLIYANIRDEIVILWLATINAIYVLRTLNTWILHVSLHLLFIVTTSLLQDVVILKLHISWQTLQNMMYINRETINSCRKCKKDIVVWNESQCRCFKIVRKCYVEFLAYLTSSFFFDDKWEQFLTDALFIGHVKPNKSI